MSLDCPGCTSDNIIRIGEIPPYNRFAGRLLDDLLPGGCLYRCKICHLYFRWPLLSKSDYEKLYREARPTHWQNEPEHRNDWKIAANFLNSKLGQGKVLDFGCWDGGFLNYLEVGWQRYGIEINQIAIRKAKKAGISILKNNLDELDQISTQFDAVVAFDFIEHTINPTRFLEQISRLVRTDGFIILSSGNTEALTWKISGSRYWYCTISEHISFINTDWCIFSADKLNLEIVCIEIFSHAYKAIFTQRILEFLKNIAYLIAPRAYNNLRKIVKIIAHSPQKGDIKIFPPFWMTSKDHFIIIFKKN